MPRTRSLVWSELKLGVLTIAALVIAATTIFLIMGGKGFFWQRYNLKTRFANVAGLKSGSPVRLAGVEVGSVSGVQLAGNEVDVAFQVNRSYRNQITNDSLARLGSVSLLGESAVDITPSASGTPVPEWGYVPSEAKVTQFSDLTSQASQGIQDLTSVLHGLREGQGTIGKLMTDDQLYTELTSFVTSARDVTQAMRNGQGAMGRFMSDPQLAASLEHSLKNLDELTSRINSGQGSIGRLMTDEGFARSLETTTKNLSQVTERLEQGQGTLGKLMTDDTLFTRLDTLSNSLDQMVDRLNQGKGTAGQLLQDEKLYENMNQAVTDFRSLLTEIRKDPRKYLNVKVSIF
jgi:phospholipid/cholesterol/gamma-HCH transport system substrate-binding protein